MSTGLSCVVVVLTLGVVLFPHGSTGYKNCLYKDLSSDECEFFSEMDDSSLPMIFGIIVFVVFLLIVICCCVCPCCCLYKICRSPRPVIATSTHTTVVTTSPQQYPQQYPRQPASAAHGPPQSYQGAQYPAYQPVPVQPGYGAQPMPSTPYQGQPYMPGPPPTYQEAIGPMYPPQPMPYSQAGYNPGQAPYPLQPPAQAQAQAQANAPLAGPDYLAQPAYNPQFVAPPPKHG